MTLHSGTEHDVWLLTVFDTFHSLPVGPNLNPSSIVQPSSYYDHSKVWRDVKPCCQTIIPHAIPASARFCVCFRAKSLQHFFFACFRLPVMGLCLCPLLLLRLSSLLVINRCPRLDFTYSLPLPASACWVLIKVNCFELLLPGVYLNLSHDTN